MKTLIRTVTTICLLSAMLIGCGGGGGGNENQPPVKTWGTAAPIIETNDKNNFSPQIAMNANGDAIAVWIAGTEYYQPYNVWANRYVASTGWETAGPITDDNSYFASPQIAMDSGGNAMAVWIQCLQPHCWIATIRASRYTAGAGWGATGPIGAALIDSFQMAMDVNGNAIVVWAESCTTDFLNCAQVHVLANRYTANVGWGTAVPIETAAGFNHNPQIAMNANGDAIAVWAQCTTDTSCIQQNIWANRYVAGAGWETAVLIGSGVLGNVSYSEYPQIAMDANGDAIAVWTQCPDVQCAQVHVLANRYTANAGWGTAVPIETAAGFNYDPQIAMNANGDAIVVWTQCLDFQCTQGNILANRYTADTGWGTVAPIETDTNYISWGYRGTRIAMDANGDAIAVWTQCLDTPCPILANRYVAGTGWGTAAPIVTNAQYNYDPQIAMDPSGDAIAVWTQSDVMGTSHNIWANEFK